MWETSNSPAWARVHRCSLSTPGGVLHRHVVAGEADHAGARAPMGVGKRRSKEGLGGHGVDSSWRRGWGGWRPPSSVAPPLSSSLRDSGRASRPCSVGETSACPLGARRHVSFQRPQPARSFCLSVSGAVAPSAPNPRRDRCLPRERAEPGGAPDASQASPTARPRSPAMPLHALGRLEAEQVRARSRAGAGPWSKGRGASRAAPRRAPPGPGRRRRTCEKAWARR